MTKEEIAKILNTTKDFSNMDLSGADLTDANLSGANLYGADLSGADLSGANLIGADLSGANLSGANLIGANLLCANLLCANLLCANLYGANLSDANLSGANLSDANLRCADLRKANLNDTKLDNVKYNESTSFFNMVCPEEDSFIGWKKCKNNIIVKLEIPADAKRSSATTRKCRCNKAKVIDFYDLDKNKLDIDSAVNRYNNSFIYKKGEIVEVADFDENRWNECSTGIHFFMNFNEAKKY